MTLTPEQIEQGWKLHDGSDVCPIKDERTVHQVMFRDGQESPSEREAHKWSWGQSSAYRIIAYRIIEAHGADAAPARPTPFPASYDELVWDADGWSQTIIVDGKRPEWLRDDDECSLFCRSTTPFKAGRIRKSDDYLAIRVRRREPKRETVQCFLIVTARSPSLEFQGTIDLIDGQPDLSTLKIEEGAL